MNEPTKHDPRVLFCCWGCEQNDPESSVHMREAIGVMPDGTWLCEECYRECDNRDHGMEPNDDDDVDFLYPEFDDLPRPEPYAVAPHDGGAPP